MKNLLKNNLLPFMYLCFVMYWYLFLNRYQTLFFREQAQLFQFSWAYFMQYLSLPAGITGYAASFLIQFFHYPAVGACIYFAIFFALYKTFQTVLRKYSLFENSQFIPALPSLLFLPVSAHIQFDPAWQLSLIPALAGFTLLTAVAEKKFYYLYIPALVALLYLFAGSNIIITTVLFVFYSLTRREKKWKPCLLSVAATILVSLFFLHFVYLTSFREACFRYTPFREGKPQGLFVFHAVSWLSVLLIPPVGMLFRKIRIRAGGYKYLFMDAGLFVIAAGVILKHYNPNMENVLKMIYYAENRQWEKILDVSVKMPAGPFSCFYANMALQKKGELGERMFHYSQIGLPGLFISSEDMISCCLMSDLYYQMGVFNESRRYAFESMVSFSGVKEISLLSMKRLVSCAILQKNAPLVSKYGGILARTLFYRDYVHEHKDDRAEEHLSGTGNAVNVFGKSLLVSILENNPRHKMAFEYLMAYYMLDGDYESAKNCFDTWYSNFDYTHIPTHYAELLILYNHISRSPDEAFFEKYPVPEEMRESFGRMNMLLATKRNSDIIHMLENQFKHTYWYYIQFPLVSNQKK
jgi:hypothetical protein